MENNEWLKFKLIVIGCFFLYNFERGSHHVYGEESNIFNGSKSDWSWTDRSVDLRNVSKNENCTKESVEEFPEDLFSLESRRKGAILLHCFFAFYLFILLNFVCNDYFVPSIKTLCDRLFISKDVAGATFMAAATSSPELFVNCIGTFVAKGDLGLGTIVGSAMFNILAVPACCGLLCRQSVKIDWWPLTRDCLAYGATLILLVAFLSNGSIDWTEALVLVTLYVFYFTAMYNHDLFYNFANKIFNKKRQCKVAKIIPESIPLLHSKKRFFQMWEAVVQVDENIMSKNVEANFSSRGNFDEKSLWTSLKKFGFKCFYFLAVPLTFLLHLTIPDCKEKKKQNLWPFTLLMCIVWIGCTSYLVSWMITILGSTLSIPDSVMGLTFLAAGMSIPEATSSVIVTNQGYGSMGISSSIGSNTFDILLCLGLPWFIKSAFFPAEPGNHVIKINSQGLSYTSICLLISLIILYGSFFMNRFFLDRKIGLISLAMYIMFLIFSCLIELNIF